MFDSYKSLSLLPLARAFPHFFHNIMITCRVVSNRHVESPHSFSSSQSTSGLLCLTDMVVECHSRTNRYDCLVKKTGTHKIFLFSSFFFFPLHETFKLVWLLFMSILTDCVIVPGSDASKWPFGDKIFADVSYQLLQDLLPVAAGVLHTCNSSPINLRTATERPWWGFPLVRRFADHADLPHFRFLTMRSL